MYPDESLLDKKSTSFATSSADPNRARDISSQRASFSSLLKHSFIFVSITPQLTAFTLIPLRPTSFAIAFVNEFTAPFEAE